MRDINTHKEHNVCEVAYKVLYTLTTPFTCVYMFVRISSISIRFAQSVLGLFDVYMIRLVTTLVLLLRYCSIYIVNVRGFCARATNTALIFRVGHLFANI